MTQTSHLKSLPITNLDAIPAVQNTSGVGAPGRLIQVDGFVSTVSADATGSTYQLVRVPSNCKVKAVVFEAAAMTAGKLSLSVYYSDATQDGTASANQGLIVPTTGAAFFALDIDCSSAVGPTNETNQSGNYPIANREKELWDALALSADPGGFFDVVAVCHTTAITTGAAVYLKVDYII
jgi:hypothetical protein